MKTNNELISIVVPVYNVEKYLERCLDSLITQTYDNIEIILVDDGSTDESNKICQDYKEKDKRINIIKKENGGQSEARNYGIKKANGKYICFVDSDDYIDEDYVEYLYSLITKNQSEISICSYKAIYEDGGIISQANGKEYVLSPREAIEKTLYHEDFNVSAWAKMYKTVLFEDIEFPVGKIFEEVETIYKLFLKSNKIAIGLNSKYNYMIRDNSTLTGKFSEKKLYLTTAYNNMGTEVLKIYPDLYQAVTRANIYAHISTLRQIINCKPRLKEKEKELKCYIMNHYKEIINNSRVQTRDKIACITLKLGIPIFKFSWIMYCKLTGRNL